MNPFMLQAGILELQAGIIRAPSGAQRPTVPNRDCKANHRARSLQTEAGNSDKCDL